MFDDIQYQRFHLNKNLHVIYDKFYQGFKMYTRKGPLIKEWVDAIFNTLSYTLQQYPYVTIMRADLRFADYMPYFDETFMQGVFQRFIESFKAKIEHNRAMTKKLTGRVNDTDVRYIWCREYEHDGKPHIHFACFLNGSAFHHPGWLESEESSLAKMISEAWCSAVRAPWNEEKGLVFIPTNCMHRVNRNRDSYAHAITHLSYMCKIRTKRFGIGLHSFGCSRH